MTSEVFLPTEITSVKTLRTQISRDKWEDEKAWVGKTHLDAEVASVDVVSKEEVVGVGGFASDFEELHEIKLQFLDS